MPPIIGTLIRVNLALDALEIFQLSVMGMRLFDVEAGSSLCAVLRPCIRVLSVRFRENRLNSGLYRLSPNGGSS
jgi:hypothetical protein